MDVTPFKVCVERTMLAQRFKSLKSTEAGSELRSACSLSQRHHLITIIIIIVVESYHEFLHSDLFFKDIGGICPTGQSAHCGQVATVTSHCFTNEHAVLAAYSRLPQTITYLQPDITTDLQKVVKFITPM